MKQYEIDIRWAIKWARPGPPIPFTTAVMHCVIILSAVFEVVKFQSEQIILTRYIDYILIFHFFALIP